MTIDCTNGPGGGMCHTCQAYVAGVAAGACGQLDRALTQEKLDFSMLRHDQARQATELELVRTNYKILESSITKCMDETKKLAVKLAEMEHAEWLRKASGG